jgi:hypothetical protein
MNLTSKRMLQFALLCAGVCALSATAATHLGDSFENDVIDAFPATNGMPIVFYKATNNGFGLPLVTNWFTADGDASKIVNADVVNQGYAASPRPMAGAVSNLVLNLETEGQTLMRTAGSSLPFSDASPIYVDTLIKFTPSEDDPSILDSSVKAAVFVNVHSNLCIFHGVEGAGNNPVSTPTTVAINPEQWYRLTIRLSNMPDAELDKVFQVYLDGVLIEDDDGMSLDYEPSTGSYFYSASNQGSLSAVAFQGTGMVDELVIADEVTLTFASSVMLTLDWAIGDDGLFAVTVGGTPVAKGGTVAKDSEIVIDANDWYEITSVTGTGDATYVGLPVPGALVNVSTGIVSATSEQTITIDVQPFSTSTGIATGLGGGSYPADKVATWAIANSLSASALTGAMLDDYLCNLAPGTNPELVITDIVVDSNTGIATITVGSTGNAVDFDTINGTLVVYTASALDTLLTEPAGTEFTVTLQLNQTATIEVDMAGNNFIKAVIK